MGRASNPKVGPALFCIVRPRVIVPGYLRSPVRCEGTGDDPGPARVRTWPRQVFPINALVALLRAACWFNLLVHSSAPEVRAA